MSWRDRPYSGGSGGGWGSGGPTFRGNPFTWAPTIGTVFGIRVQIHILFLIYIAIELLRAVTSGGQAFWWHFRYLAMLFGLVFLHELGHCFGARRTGGTADHVLMWPLGGLAYVAPPHRPTAHLITAVSGPMVNVLLGALAAVVLVIKTGSIDVLPLVPFTLSLPYTPELWPLLRSPWLWLILFFHVNYTMAVFNLCMPVYPLDGGQVLQSILWHPMSYGRAMRIATSVGLAGAVIFGCIGLFTQNFLLLGVAIFGYITCQQQRQSVASESVYGYGNFEEPQQTRSPTRRRSWLSGRWARRQKALADEQAEVDRILAKVHDSGLASLTRKEKKILAQATRRQQDREEERQRRA